MLVWRTGEKNAPTRFVGHDERAGTSLRPRDPQSPGTAATRRRTAIPRDGKPEGRPGHEDPVEKGLPGEGGLVKKG
jgi:hypothetical protein